MLALELQTHPSHQNSRCQGTVGMSPPFAATWFHKTHGFEKQSSRTLQVELVPHATKMQVFFPSTFYCPIAASYPVGTGTPGLSWGCARRFAGHCIAFRCSNLGLKASVRQYLRLSRTITQETVVEVRVPATSRRQTETAQTASLSRDTLRLVLTQPPPKLTSSSCSTLTLMTRR